MGAFMDSGFDVIYQCQRLLRVCVVAVLLVFWIPFIVLALDVVENRYLSNALAGLVVGGPLVVMVAVIGLSLQFLRSIPDSAIGTYWPMLLVACVTAIPFFNVLGPVICLQMVQRYLGRSPSCLPTALPNRRCRCGSTMTLVGGVQIRKWIGNEPVGYIAAFACGQCPRRIEIPSLEMMFLKFMNLGVVLLFLCGGWTWLYSFARSPETESGPVIFAVTLALGITGFAWVHVIRLVRQLTNRLRFSEREA